MNIVGIISEYNPFHSGHAHHIREARRITDADGVIAVMSGHFVQRGEVALTDKWTRAKAALCCGVDLILDLPFLFACQSAGTFGAAGVDILAATGVCSNICFGSEIDRLDILSLMASILVEEPLFFKNKFDELLSLGLSFPSARKKALAYYFRESGITTDIPIDELSSPNTILGIAYLRRIIKMGYDIKPVIVKRIGAGYLDPELKGSISSATAIRNALYKSQSWDEISIGIPDEAARILLDAFHSNMGPVFTEQLGPHILAILRSRSEKEISRIDGVVEGLENRLKEACISATGWEDLLVRVKTKRYTKTKLQRVLIHILANLTKEVSQKHIERGPQYIRVIGYNERGMDILRLMRKKAGLPMTSRGKIRRHSAAQNQLDWEHRATGIWATLLPSQENRHGEWEARKMPVRAIPNEKAVED